MAEPLDVPGDTSGPTLRACRVRVHGQVQGVGFREACVEQARRLGVRGWVRNRRDGSVEALIHGSALQVDGMLAWLAQGPPTARVDRLDHEPVMPAPADLVGFERRATE